ncbi:Zinc finger BED domain-containing protein 4 [Argiope bruennichi]|uniref:Zinc finger BED domain-containing protein 4 n=1 Tax=Argiope bruennichi TaxID=94029 RepID=A0A8T0F7G3_ARGBR|nr:Zinc finger BED domain-containing protein 4 [Argiope bruennichi]
MDQSVMRGGYIGKRKRSPIWTFFTAVDETHACCNICKNKLSYETTVTNLTKHMMKKHPTVRLKELQRASCNIQVNEEAIDEPIPGPSRISTLEPENNALNPAYRLPSRDTIVNTLLPSIYEEVSHDVERACFTIKKACVTADYWTSVDNESFMAVTAHYLDEEFKMNSLLLEVSVFNIVRTIRNELRWPHLGCFAHNLNLIIKDALAEFSDLIEKVKTIVCHFKRSSLANSKLLECQVTAGKEAKEIIQDVPTRWNSTFHMIERFVELESFIRTTVALLDADLPHLTTKEWKTLQLLCKILKPFEDATTMASGENYITASLVIVVVNGLRDVCAVLLNSPDVLQDAFAKNTVTNLNHSLLNRLGNVENDKIRATSTFLDLRFKDVAFKNKLTAENVKWQLTNSVANMLNEGVDDQVDNNQAMDNSTDFQQLTLSLWDSFDRKVSEHKPKGTINSRALLEINRYLEEGIISRKLDPLLCCILYIIPSLV